MSSLCCRLSWLHPTFVDIRDVSVPLKQIGNNLADESMLGSVRMAVIEGFVVRRHSPSFSLHSNKKHTKTGDEETKCNTRKQKRKK